MSDRSRGIYTPLKWLIPVVALWVGTGCASNPTGGTNLVLMSEKKELDLGAQYSQQIEAQYGIYTKGGLNDYVNRVGQTLAKVSHRPDISYKFTVLDDDTINAFALPGGYIYITRGMLAHMNSEAELAAVLGHEIAHVTARHAVRQDSQSKVLGAIGTVASVASGTPGVFELSGIFNGALIKGYGRSHELEADELGAEYMTKAGYSSQGMLRTIEILRQKEKFEYEQARREGRRPNVYHGLFSSHPDHATRTREALKAANRFGSEAASGVTNEETFVRAIDGISYGKKNTVGVLRENIFYHPRLGIKLFFPEGWRLDNQGNRVQAISDDNNAILQITGMNYGRVASPEKYMRDHMGLGNIRDGRSVTIDGMPAYIAIADRAQSPFGMRPVRAAVIFDTRRRMAYVMRGAGRKDLSKVAADGNFITTIFSLDRMSRDDFTVAKPLILSVMEAQPETTMESLSEDSPLPNYALEQLRLINGLYPDGQPETGQLLKVVK